MIHNAELNLVRRVLDEEEFGGALFRGVKGEYFTDKDIGKVWDYTLEHWTEYGKIPAHETIFELFPTLSKDLVKVNPQEPADFYADSILSAYAQRGAVKELMTVLPKLQTDVEQGLNDLAAVAAKYTIIRRGVDVLDLQNTARERYDDYTKDKERGIKFGWPTLDRLTLGSQRGQLIGFVARGGQGKSWLLMFNALQAWKQGKKVLMIATELTPLDMLKRFDALYLGCNYNIFRKQNLANDEFDRYKTFLFDGNEEDNKRMQIVSGYGLTPSAINVLIDHHKPDIVFIDGVYLLESDAKYTNGADWQKVRFLANELKHKVAKKKNIPVVFNTQFNRSVGTTLGKSKKIQGGVEDIGYGDEFGKAADLLVGVHREEEDLFGRLLTLTVIKGREVEDGLNWQVVFNFEKLSFGEFTDQAEPFEQAKDEGVDW